MLTVNLLITSSLTCEQIHEKGYGHQHGNTDFFGAQLNLQYPINKYYNQHLHTS